MTCTSIANEDFYGDLKVERKSTPIQIKKYLYLHDINIDCTL
jgi:hypothetical protein